MLMNEGHEIELACNFDSPLNKSVSDLNLVKHHIPFDRNPFSIQNVQAYKELDKLISQEKYDVVHCHTPNASVITRLVCKKYRKKGLKVFYTSHGFHFYKGAPIKNWVLYYPVEKLCSQWTDKLLTINHEDYNLAKNKFHAHEVIYIPGVGLDTKKFHKINVDIKEERKSLGLDEKDFVLISVGELNDNKNHQVIIKALSKMDDINVKYIIAGVGPNEKKLSELIISLHLENQVKLLGYRNDVLLLYNLSDACCFPSIREGLGMAALEGMACGLPLIASDNRGVRDFCVNHSNGIVCRYNDEIEFKNAISYLKNNKNIIEQMKTKNEKKVNEFDIKNTLSILKNIY